MLVVFEFFECLSLNACRLLILECLSSFSFHYSLFTIHYLVVFIFFLSSIVPAGSRLVRSLDVSPSRSVAISQCPRLSAANPHASLPHHSIALCLASTLALLPPMPSLLLLRPILSDIPHAHSRRPTFGDFIAACPVLADIPASILSSFTPHFMRHVSLSAYMPSHLWPFSGYALRLCAHARSMFIIRDVIPPSLFIVWISGMLCRLSSSSASLNEATFSSSVSSNFMLVFFRSLARISSARW